MRVATKFHICVTSKYKNDRKKKGSSSSLMVVGKAGGRYRNSNGGQHRSDMKHGNGWRLLASYERPRNRVSDIESATCCMESLLVGWKSYVAGKDAVGLVDVS